VLCCIVCLMFGCSLSVKLVSHYTVDARLFLQPRCASRGEQAAGDLTDTKGIIFRENLFSDWCGCPDNLVANLLAAY
jgi:hypothetical protein